MANKFIDLSTLPRKGKRIDWTNSINHKVKFYYDNIKGELNITQYISGKQPRVVVEYLGKTKTISIGHLSSCKIATLVEKYNKDFKYDIGNIIKAKYGDLEVIEQKRNEANKIRGYTVMCSLCETTSWVSEYELNENYSCNKCNLIWHKARWMVDLGVSVEDAKKYTYNSDKRINVICPDCKMSKEIRIGQIFLDGAISCICSSKQPYPEKFMANVLNQLGVDFKKEYSPNWKFLEKRRYDFYIPSLNMIIETHGKQHYEECNRGRTLEEEQENDRIKEQLALNNKIRNYIVIDCRYSDVEWIKNSILNSELSNLFDLSNINWLEADEFATRNLDKDICEYWNVCDETTTLSDIAEKFDVSPVVVANALKRGSLHGWCEYDRLETKRRASMRAGKKNGSPVALYKDSELIKEFASKRELESVSEKILGFKISSYIANKIINGKILSYRGCTVKEL